MKTSIQTHRETEENGLHQYLLDRPELLLKMLDVAEHWQAARASASRDARLCGRLENEHRKAVA